MPTVVLPVRRKFQDTTRTTSFQESPPIPAVAREEGGEKSSASGRRQRHAVCRFVEEEEEGEGEGKGIEGKRGPVPEKKKAPAIRRLQSGHMKIGSLVLDLSGTDGDPDSEAGDCPSARSGHSTPEYLKGWRSFLAFLSFFSTI